MSSIHTLKNLPTLLFCYILLSCTQVPESSPKTETLAVERDSTIANPERESAFLMETGEKTSDSILISGKTVLIVKLDSLEINQLIKFYGKENFYTATDDLMWYNAQLYSKLDSLNIPISNTEADCVLVNSIDTSFTITKDTSFSIYTYFLFEDGKLNRVELFNLLGI